MKTYLDTGVLIAAFRAEGAVGQRAMAVVDDQTRVFASSVFVRLELLPKAVYHQQPQEIQFYETFFNAVSDWADDVDQITHNAYNLPCDYGLAALDALHVAAALSLQVDELVTTERKQKPMHRIPGLRVMSITDHG